jgi:two-component system, LytTR family, response regulator
MLYLTDLSARASEILYLEGARNYTIIHWCNGQLELFSKSISVIMERLPANDFVRISKQYGVNRAYMVRYGRQGGQRVAELQTNQVLRVARRRVASVKASLADW